MSEREQKLEAALRRAFYLGEVHWQQADSESYRQNAKAEGTWQKLEALVAETLATPPTSEWNEAIEQCARRCTYEKARELRALKRKEGT